MVKVVDSQDLLFGRLNCRLDKVIVLKLPREFHICNWI